VLDDQGKPVGPGERAEINIGGRGLARYLRGGGERFRPDPEAAGALLYRTGDLGAWTAQGNLEVIGRIDRQVKIRGFRVEPAEVEAALAAHDGIDNIVVTAHRHDGDTRLTAYYTPRTPQATAPLRAFARRYLPDHMVPSAFVALDELPLTSAGKVDLTALPSPEAARPVAVGPTDKPTTGTDAPTVDPLERGVVRLWQHVLGVERADGEDNFFAVGGNSILATELVAGTRRSFGLLITQVRPLIRRLVEDGTLRGFVAAVRAARAGVNSAPRAASGSTSPPRASSTCRSGGSRPRRSGPTRAPFCSPVRPASSASTCCASS
jgi:hypothetical protein